MNTINFIKKDETINSKDFQEENLSIKDLKESFGIDSSQTVAIIPKDNYINFQTSYIESIIQITNKNYTQKLDTRLETIIYPIIVTPSNKTAAAWETTITSSKKEVTIISDKDGLKKKAIYIITPQHGFTGNNALIPVEVGDYLIKTTRNNNLYSSHIFQILTIHENDNIAKLQYIDYISDNPERSKVSYRRFYEIYPNLRMPIKASKNKIKKGKTFDIHYAEYKHLLKSNNIKKI